MKIVRVLLPFLITLIACNPEPAPPLPEPETLLVRAVDISALPIAEERNFVFKDEEGSEVDVLAFLQSKGVNTVRLRLWHSPADQHSSLEEVDTFTKRLRAQGLKLWLSLHYSDDWADPGKQSLPKAWGNIPPGELHDSLSHYTAKVVARLRPDIIQIGNEINDGFLWPHGRASLSQKQFVSLLDTAIGAVQRVSPETKIMIHFAGHEGAADFFAKLDNLHYDQIGLSYYPWWHGKDMAKLEADLAYLKNIFDKEVLIAETAYPFTLDWNDWTNNNIGLETQLILPDFPANPEGQSDFLVQIKKAVIEAKGSGICYWGASWVAFDGPQSAAGSPWENLACFDFEGNALPIVEVFGE
ncbi:MAG: arabinogalactan endo-beta-1,4-galactanase [Bacteroidia bacterium]